MIIEEELYDREFVANYINGWDAFKERVMTDYPLEKVEEITWIDKDLIRKAARMYATTKPACIHWGVPTEQTNNCVNYTRTTHGTDGHHRQSGCSRRKRPFCESAHPHGG